MRQDLKSVAATLAGSGNSGVERVKHLVVASALALVVTGCGLPADGAVPQAGNSSEERSAAAHPALTPVLLHPNLVPVTSGPNE
jgi:hypothetical protein